MGFVLSHSLRNYSLLATCGSASVACDCEVRFVRPASRRHVSISLVPRSLRLRLSPHTGTVNTGTCQPSAHRHRTARDAWPRFCAVDFAVFGAAACWALALYSADDPLCVHLSELNWHCAAVIYANALCCAFVSMPPPIMMIMGRTAAYTTGGTL